MFMPASTRGSRLLSMIQTQAALMQELCPSCRLAVTQACNTRLLTPGWQ